MGRVLLPKKHMQYVFFKCLYQRTIIKRPYLFGLAADPSHFHPNLIFEEFST